MSSEGSELIAIRIAELKCHSSQHLTLKVLSRTISMMSDPEAQNVQSSDRLKPEMELTAKTRISEVEEVIAEKMGREYREYKAVPFLALSLEMDGKPPAEI